MYTVVIPSSNLTNLTACLSHLQERRIVVVRETPFIFARACNAGIRAADNDDVVLLNDDALLASPSSLLELETLSKAHPEFGLISAAIDGVCIHTHQHPRPGIQHWLAPFPTLAFICVYIPRATINRIGLLDQQFIGYGWEDDDYCRRNRNAGMAQAVCGTCIVNHKSLPSTFRHQNAANCNKLLAINLALFRKKWNIPLNADPRLG